MALLYWIPGVVVLLVGANLVRWWLRSGLTKGQVLVTGVLLRADGAADRGLLLVHDLHQLGPRDRGTVRSRMPTPWYRCLVQS